MIAINKALADRRDVKIITAKGSDVTKVGFYREKLERDEDDETRNIDDIIIRATKNQADARRQMFGEAGMGDAQPAILLTEDTNMRVKANARGVPAISTTNLKRYLVQLGTRMSPRLRHKPTPTAFVAMSRVDADDPLHDPIGGIELVQKGPNRRRPFRRGTAGGTMPPHT
jgi:rRNA-processing protein FCF1